MKYIYKFPILLSIVFAIITAVSSLANGKDVTTMAYDVSIVIILTYPAGMIIKSIIIKTIKEVLVKKYILEQQEKMRKRKNMKEDNSDSEFEIKV